MPTELTAHEAAKRLKMGIKRFMPLYRAGEFPNVVFNRSARDVKIPIEDIEAYEKRISGANATDELGKINYEIEVITKRQELAKLHKQTEAEKAGYETVDEFLQDSEWVKTEKTRLAKVDAGQTEVTRQQGIESYRLDQDRINSSDLAQWLEILEDWQVTLEEEQRHIDSQEERNSRIATDSRKADEKVKAMMHYIVDLQRLINKKSKLDSWMDGKARKRLDISIQETINKAYRLYSEGHGITTDKEGKIIY